MDTKVCSKCQKSWPITAFYSDKHWKDGFHPWCKTCLSEARNKRYQKKCIDQPPSYRWHRDKINHMYFSLIGKPLQAYILGFLAADGNVLSSVPRITIELSTKDQSLLELVRDELAPGHAIRFRTRDATSNRFGSGESATLAFTSPTMVSDLARFGIVPNKTLTMRWPSELPLHLASAFILGYFDGDGHITSTINSGHFYDIWGITSGSPDFLRDIISIVKDLTGIPIGGPYHKGARSYTIRVTGNKAVQIDEWLHASGLGLARKHIAIIS